MPAASNPLLQEVAERLVPLFQADGIPQAQARAAALDAITACQPQSPADYASIGRILAFSLAAIAAIARAADTALPPNVQLRYLGKANTLSRSAAQAERAMTQRRQLSAQPPRIAPRTAAPPQPAPVVTNEAVLAQVESAMAECRGFLAPTAGQPALPQPALPFAAGPAARPPSFRQTLRQQTTLGTLRAGT